MNLSLITLRSLTLSLSLVGAVANAYPWNSEPQPLVENMDAIQADAGSPLVWDSGSRVLWFTSYRTLRYAIWDGTGFHAKYPDDSFTPYGGMALDSGWHQLYALNVEGRLCCVDAKRSLSQIGSETLTTVLGVDQKLHCVFAYDAAAKGIRMYQYAPRRKTWSSVLIASGLGNPGDQAAVDSDLHIIYSTHETADASLPRHPHVTPVGDPTGIGGWRPWPLVATAFDGKTWTSKVLDETGVPQLPAVMPLLHTLCFARRDAPDDLYFYQPKFYKFAETFLGKVKGWAGTPTYEDSPNYVIKQPQYPAQWSSSDNNSSSFMGSFTINNDGVLWWLIGLPSLQCPITVVPYYEPIWTDVAMPRRLLYFSAQFNNRQSRLNQHREIATGEVVRTQTGRRLAGYLYKDANGVLATSGQSNASSGRWDSSPTIIYPVMVPTFDAQNLPSEIAALNSTTAQFYSDNAVTSRASTQLGPNAPANQLPSWYSTNPNAPFVQAHLRQPTNLTLSTFGHSYISHTTNQTGARYRNYSGIGTGFAIPSSLAIDPNTGLTFYTQPPAPAIIEEGSWSSLSAPQSTPPLAGFQPEPDPKLPEPPSSQVWIDVVY